MLSNLLATFGIQWAGWTVASLLKTEKFYDLTGSATFCYLILRSFSKNNAPKSFSQQVQAGCVLTWAVRLGSYLFMRIIKSGKDRRFDVIKQNPKQFFFAWTMQGVWVFATLLPTLIMLQKRKETEKLNWRHYVGWSCWTIGFLFETLSDYQKWKFNNDPNVKDQFIRSGLWSISRHPNYFGEILLWFGLFISASTNMKGLEYLSILGPIFDALLITKLSGIPILERNSMKKWGKNVDYLTYVKNTAILIPYIW